MSVGKIGPFDLAKDNWEMYVDRLEQYFVANEVKSEVKVATLITVIGSEAYELMVNLCTPDKPATKTYEQLVTLMKGHLNPKPSVLAERFKFRQRVQNRNENIANFVTELKKLSKDCGFTGDTLKENLRDQFVCGLLNDDIRQKLFTETDSITFDRAYKLAVSMEAAEVNAALVDDCARNRTGDSVPASASTCVHQLGRAGWGRAATATDGGGRPAVAVGRPGRGKITSGGGPSAISGAENGKFRGFGRNNVAYSNTECKVCGANHETERCKFKNYVCRVCNQEGHLKKMCPKLRGKLALYNVNEEEVVYSDDSGSYESDEVNIFSLNSSDSISFAPYTIDVYIEGTLLTMEIDTGSCISCISLECYKKLFTHCELQESNLVLRYYTGENIKPIGKITPKTSKRFTLRETFARFGLPMEVVSDNGPPFTSKEYAHFMTINGIKMTFTAAYHPASNGAAENAVKLCKRALKKALRDGCDVDEALQAYLMMYRNVEHSTTGTAPAILLQRRRLRSRLDLLRGDRQVGAKVQQAQDNQVLNARGTTRELNVGDSVWARDHAGGSWFGGQIEDKVGSRNFIIGRDSGSHIKRHIDQIKKRRSSYAVSSSDNSETASGERTVEKETAQGARALEHVAEPDVAEVEEPRKDEDVVPRDATETIVSPADRPKRIRKPVQRYGFELDYFYRM